MDGYYDGIPEKIKKMTIEEIEEAIKIEEKKCEIMDKNSKQLGGIMDDKKTAPRFSTIWRESKGN